MSVCNFYLSSDRVMILTDAVTYAGKAPAGLHRKIAVNHEARLAISTLGLVGIGDIFKKMLTGWHGRSDAEVGIETFMSHFPDEGFQRADGSRKGYAVTLFGWQKDGPFVTRWTHDPDVPPVRHDFEPGLYLAPSLGKQMSPPNVTPEQMKQVAELQQRVATSNGLQMCIGGWMDMTIIDARGIRCEHLADYPDRAMTEARIAQKGVARGSRRAVVAA